MLFVIVIEVAYAVVQQRFDHYLSRLQYFFMFNVTFSSEKYLEIYSLYIIYVMCGILHMGSDGNSAVKIEMGRGSEALSLHCKDSEFPSNFDVVP